MYLGSSYLQRINSINPLAPLVLRGQEKCVSSPISRLDFKHEVRWGEHKLSFQLSQLLPLFFRFRFLKIVKQNKPFNFQSVEEFDDWGAVFITFGSSRLDCRLIWSRTVDAWDRSETKLIGADSRGSALSSSTTQFITAIYHFSSNVNFSFFPEAFKMKYKPWICKFRIINLMCSSKNVNLR